MLPCSMNQLTQLLDRLTPERKPDLMEGKYRDIGEVCESQESSAKWRVEQQDFQRPPAFPSDALQSA